jgi:hypothetical protein
MNLDSALRIFMALILVIYFTSVLIFDTYTVYSISIILISLISIPVLIYNIINLSFFMKKNN